jgi:YegS/Rv2252/BmrU family lipid kinase
MKPEKIFLLANTSARTLDLAALHSVSAMLDRHIPCSIVPTSSRQHAIETAAELSRCDTNLVVACGGDGTINTIVNAVAPSACIGIIPAGTANVIARELGIPLDMKNAAKTLLTGAVQEIDVGCCTGHKFVFVAGTGFDAWVADRVSPLLKRVFGRAAYHIAGIKAFLSYRPAQIVVKSSDGRSFTGYFAITANMRRYGGELYFAPEARYDDNMLDLILLQQFNVRSLLRLLNYARGNGSFPQDIAIMARDRAFTLQTSQPEPYQLDGEVFAAESCFRMSLAESKARIITP